MPPGTTQTSRQEWPNGIYSTATFNITGEPKTSFKAQNGKSYVDLTTESDFGRVAETFILEDLNNYVNQSKVSVARLWSTGLWGLIKNPDTGIYSAVKLFRVDLATSQDSLESRMPYAFWNGFSPKPYKQIGNGPWHFLVTSRSPYSYKTSTQLRDWIELQKKTTPGFNSDIVDQIVRSGNAQSPSGNTDLGVKYFDLKVNDYLTLQLPVSNHPWANANWYINFDVAVREALVARGYSSAVIAQSGYQIIDSAIRKLEALGAPGSNSTGIGGGSTGSTNRVTSPPSTPTTSTDGSLGGLTVVVRLPNGSQLVDIDAMSKLDQGTIKPHMRQAYVDSTGERVEDSFYFDYVPSTISYTLGGSSWNEIPRTFGDPLIEWQSYGLTRVQMTFLIAGKRLIDDGNSVPDGLNVDIEDRIQLLRRMATRTSPVVIYGLDDIFNIQLLRSQTTGEPCAWAISDLAITAKRRTEGPPSLISVAQVNISLIELPIERSVAFKLNPLPLQVTTPTPTTPGQGRTPIRPDLWTEYLSKPLESVLLIQT